VPIHGESAGPTVAIGKVSHQDYGSTQERGMRRLNNVLGILLIVGLHASSAYGQPVSATVETRDGRRIALNDLRLSCGPTLRVVDEGGISMTVKVSDLESIAIVSVSNGVVTGHIMRWGDHGSTDNLRLYFSSITGWEHAQQQGAKITIPVAQIEYIAF
jgi:hypothetical protein